MTLLKQEDPAHSTELFITTLQAQRTMTQAFNNTSTQQNMSTVFIFDSIPSSPCNDEFFHRSRAYCNVITGHGRVFHSRTDEGDMKIHKKSLLFETEKPCLSLLPSTVCSRQRYAAAQMPSTPLSEGFAIEQKSVIRPSHLTRKIFPSPSLHRNLFMQDAGWGISGQRLTHSRLSRQVRLYHNEGAQYSVCAVLLHLATDTCDRAGSSCLLGSASFLCENIFGQAFVCGPSRTFSPLDFTIPAVVSSITF